MKMNITSNLSEVTEQLQITLNDATDVDVIARIVAESIRGDMKRRIHTDGLASDGAPIGTYSPGYMKVRTGDYGNSARVSRGKDKGKAKDSGFFTKGQQATYNIQTRKADVARPNYKRTNDTKVVISLTSQLENDEVTIHLGKGNYGIGCLNKHNWDKSQWVEETYKKKIFASTQAERDAAKFLIEKHINNAIS
jgi:hypothetical protein